MAVSRDFADYCCELLSGIGSPVAKRMFGGWGISVEGATIAVIGDLTKLGGNNQKLYLKADETTKTQFVAAGGKRFELESKDGKLMGMNYFTTPDEAMESPDAMLPWARLALNVALDAKAKAKPKALKAPKTAVKTPKKAAAKKVVAKK